MTEESQIIIHKEVGFANAKPTSLYTLIIQSQFRPDGK